MTTTMTNKDQELSVLPTSEIDDLAPLASPQRKRMQYREHIARKSVNEQTTGRSKRARKF
jgi:hypothetical protein